MQPDAFAEMVVLTVKTALAPMQAELAAMRERLAGFDTRVAMLPELRDRVVVVETKAALPLPQDAALVELSRLGPLLIERIKDLETKAAQPDLSRDELIHRIEGLEGREDGTPAVARELAVVKDRLLVVETLATATPAPDTTSADLKELTKAIGDLRERVAVVEVRPLVPGPPGEPGAPGKDGKDGEPGTAGLAWDGIYQEGKSYTKSQIVTWAGSAWHCNEQTDTKPGDGSKAWTLMVKRGRDGRDGKDAETLPVVSVGRRD
jgi:hypothetical protein